MAACGFTAAGTLAGAMLVALSRVPMKVLSVRPEALESQHGAGREAASAVDVVGAALDRGTACEEPGLAELSTETEVEELIERCHVEGLSGAAVWGCCRERLRDLMEAARRRSTTGEGEAEEVGWKFLAAGVHCPDQVAAATQSVAIGEGARGPRLAKAECARACEGQAGFATVRDAQRLRCTCCRRTSPWGEDGSGDRARLYRLSAVAGSQPRPRAPERVETELCRIDALDELDLGTVKFMQLNHQVSVSLATGEPRRFFQECPHLRLQDAQVGSGIWGGDALLVWIYPQGKDPVWCSQGPGDFHISVWSYYDLGYSSMYELSVCHAERQYPLPMLKASRRAKSVHVDDVATYGHVELQGATEKGVCKKLFRGALDAVEAWLSPVVVELAFIAEPADKGCGCYAGAFLAKFGALELTIGGVSFDVCSARELAQLCGSGELLKGPWQMRPPTGC